MPRQQRACAPTLRRLRAIRLRRNVPHAQWPKHENLKSEQRAWGVVRASTPARRSPAGSYPAACACCSMYAARGGRANHDSLTALAPVYRTEIFGLYLGCHGHRCRLGAVRRRADTPTLPPSPDRATSCPAPAVPSPKGLRPGKAKARGSFVHDARALQRARALDRTVPRKRACSAGCDYDRSQARTGL